VEKRSILRKENQQQPVQEPNRTKSLWISARFATTNAPPRKNPSRLKNPIPMFAPLKPLFVLICAGSTLQAAKPPGEFLDIPWRANAVAAKEILSKRPDLKISVDTPAKIVGEGGTFADYPVDHIELELQNGAFTSGTVFLTIPPDNDKNGVPLRNLLFESLSKSFRKQYGKVARGGDDNHTEENWSWVTTEPLGSKKMEITIQLSYSWAPYRFTVRYANRTVADTTPGSPKSKDL
jgi:hypothetical protein